MKKKQKLNSDKKNGSIRKKLLVTILPILAVAFIALTAIVYQCAKESIRSHAQQQLHAEGIASENMVLGWKKEKLSLFNTVADTIVNTGMSDQEILDYEKNYLGTYEDFPNGIYIGKADKSVLDASGWVPDEDITKTSWYTDGCENDTFEFGEPYQDNMTKEYVVTASRKIDDLDGQKAVIASDVSLSRLTEIVKQMSTDTTDVFIIDGKSGAILADAKDEIVGENADELEDSFYADVYQKVKNGDTEVTSCKAKEGVYMISAAQVEGTNWYIVTRQLESSIYKDIQTLGMIMSVTAVIVIIFISIILTLAVSKITGPIKNLTAAIISVTGGDFTTDLSVKGNDEVSHMGTSMRDFMKAMRGTLRGILNTAEQIDTQANQSKNLAGDLYQSAEGQAEAMSQMKENLQELVSSISVIAENATTLATVVAETDDEGKEALEHINLTMKNADEGKESMDSVTESMNVLREEMEQLGISISNVGDAAVRINEITTTISNIAQQTNLLALNASIEAARAGEAGKGFAVVADEIKNLAETSANAADEISNLIHDVTTLIRTTVDKSDESMEQINGSSERVIAASDQFHVIFESIEKTNGIMNSIIEKIHNMNDVSTNMAAITEEQSASAEEIEATAESIKELSDTVRGGSADVKKDAKGLAVTAEALKDSIKKFKIE